MSADLIRYRNDGPAAVIAFNRPDKRNALSRALVTELRGAFAFAAADPHARCVILTAEGPAFCAGMDLEELRGTLGAGKDVIWEDALNLAKLYDYIYALPKPTIAAINGHAVAGGAGFVTVCDLAVSAPEAKFGYPEVRRGLVAAMVLPHLLRHVGERLARYLLLTGELIDANAAAQAGLINQVVPAGQLLTTALSWARSLAEGGPQALVQTKELLKRCSRQALTVEEFARGSAEPRLGDECRHGLEAFFEEAARAVGPAMKPIVAIGEMLWDLLPDGPRAGGGPFNFAFHCHQLGHQAIIVSRVGDDELGNQFREKVRQFGMTDEFIQTDREHPTGTVQVQVDPQGQPSYLFAENVAWDHLEWDDRYEDLIRSAEAVCYGTLGQRAPASRHTIQHFIDAARHETWTVCDVNLRPPHYTPAVIRHAVERVPVLKMNEEELIELSRLLNFANPREFLKSLFSFRTLIVCITRGAEGCRLIDPDGNDRLIPGFPTQVVDTVGAGDAFMAGLLTRWREGKSLDEAARFANALASLVASRHGGTPHIDRAEVERLC